MWLESKREVGGDFKTCSLYTRRCGSASNCVTCELGLWVKWIGGCICGWWLSPELGQERIAVADICRAT